MKIPDPTIYPAYYGTITLLRALPFTEYKGRWQNGADFVNITWRYLVVPPIADGNADWALGGNVDLGNFPELLIQLPPLLFYHAAYLTTVPPAWHASLTVTG